MRRASWSGSTVLAAGKAMGEQAAKRIARQAAKAAKQAEGKRALTAVTKLLFKNIIEQPLTLDTVWDLTRDCEILGRVRVDVVKRVWDHTGDKTYVQKTSPLAQARHEHAVAMDVTANHHCTRGERLGSWRQQSEGKD